MIDPPTILAFAAGLLLLLNGLTAGRPSLTDDASPTDDVSVEEAPPPEA